MSEDATADPEEPTPRRGRPVVVAVAVAVVGLLLGGAAAWLPTAIVTDDDDAPGDDEVRLAIAGQFGLDPEGAGCVLAHLETAGALDDDLAASLVADALAGRLTSTPPVVEAVTTCGREALLEALTDAGVPEVVAVCASGTLADQPADVQAGVAEAPLQAGGPGREAVAACALDHLATSVEVGAGITGTDARCAAAELIDRVGLELVLVSIGALAVTDEVAAAATAAAQACA